MLHENKKSPLFGPYMEKGKVNKVIKILATTDETFEVLLEKHPKVPNEILLDEEVQYVHPVTYDMINFDVVKEAIKKIRGSAGLSGLVADGLT